MRRGAILVLMAVSFNVVAAADIGKNILLNGSFDNELRFWSHGDGIRWESNGGIGGSGAAYIHAPLAKEDGYIHEAKVEQCIQINDASLLYIEAKVRYDAIPQNAYAHRLNYIWYENETCTRGGQYGGYLEPKLNEGWQTLSVSNVKPSLSARSLRIELTQNQRITTGQLTRLDKAIKWGRETLGMTYVPPTPGAYWDDVMVATTFIRTTDLDIPSATLYARPVGENYLENGGFDKGSEGWRLGSKAIWKDDYGYTSVGAIRTELEAISGMGTGVFNQCINLDEQRHYEMGVMYQRDNNSTQSGGGRFRLTWYEEVDCDGASSIGESTDIRPVDGWQSLEVKKLWRPANARSANVSMIQSISGAGVYAGYWDDAYFVAVDD